MSLANPCTQQDRQAVAGAAGRGGTFSLAMGDNFKDEWHIVKE
jgi:hypothetical protein